MAKRITRRQFNQLAIAGAVVAPLAGVSGQQASQTQAPPKKAPSLTKDQEAKLQEALGKREEQMVRVRAHTLPYSLEPAFTFRARVAPRRPKAKP